MFAVGLQNKSGTLNIGLAIEHGESSLISRRPLDYNCCSVALCQRTGLVMKQENGQRKYTNPALTGKPEKGTEIFIGKLPRDLFEDELYPVLESYGP